MWKTGYTNIFAKRLETGAAFAGEFSGHMFFDDPRINFDDGIYAGARLIEALAADARPISERFADVPHYYNTPEGRIDVDESVKFGIIKPCASSSPPQYEVVTLDGARVEFPDGWFLVRASNTEPSLTTRFEAETPGAPGRDQGHPARCPRSSSPKSKRTSRRSLTTENTAATEINLCGLCVLCGKS